MAAVTAPGRVEQPAGEPPRGKRRWVLVGVVAAWIVVVSVLAVWSVGHERPTVPEQRDLELAVGDLQRAAGVVFAAAGAEGRPVALGPLELSRECRVTPVRQGLIAARNVTVLAPAGQTPEAVRAIANRLPAGWAADVAEGRGGTRVSLHADAGNFIGVDLTTESSTQVFSLRLTTGCRPVDGDPPSGADPAAPAEPGVLPQVLTGLDAVPAPPAVRAVTCPSGAVAASYTVDGIRMTSDLAGRMRRLAGDAKLLSSDSGSYAYRSGDVSVLVLPTGGLMRVVVSTACQ
ncbi:hypothetical protein [Paractinoplanes brasiliensis]|uniref:Uncharacterized protein n=1 Tax=Paractinoplanes brasiliensis TaxID=52695 RepID=A0A4V3C819_9ACTN|nr:hypothetical protein [Actinoplanes brasiliensis]TDO39978.1 hypothetical protein C8E87_3685 [Actinoplanes brasiliensis]GID25043.1 hypothetical protein Abr02nite_00260 [Actinoplanes brasiliensis]